MFTQRELKALEIVQLKHKIDRAKGKGFQRQQALYYSGLLKQKYNIDYEGK